MAVGLRKADTADEMNLVKAALGDVQTLTSLLQKGVPTNVYDDKV